MPMNSPVINFLNKMTDLLLLNFLFILFSLPIVTIGASLTAMYHVNLRSIRYGDGYIVKEFFKSFCRNLKQGTAAWILTVILEVLFYFDITFWQKHDFGKLSTYMTVVSVFFAFITGIIVIWLFPVIAKMDDKFGRQVKNAALMALGYFFPYTIVCAGITFGVAYLIYRNTAALFIMFLIGFSLVTYVMSFFFYRVFAKLIDEEPIGEDDPLYGAGNTSAGEKKFSIKRQNVDKKILPFSLDCVNVTEPLLVNAQNAEIEFIKKFDVERILSRFRETAGLDTKGAEPYTGWEDSLIGGHFIGHYFTACAQLVKMTGDKEVAENLSYIVKELRKCQKALNSGFLSAACILDSSNVEKQFDIEEGKAEGKTWVPWYALHKVFQGIIDIYLLTDDELALEVAKDLGLWIYNRVIKWDEKTKECLLQTEYGGMNDSLYELYKITGDTIYRDAAHQFDDPMLYERLTSRPNALNNIHANTTIPKFLGALNRVDALRKVEGVVSDEDEKYVDYVKKFFDIVVEKQSYITGGISDMEHFREGGKMDGARTQCNCESCCSYNMLKLARKLFLFTGEKKYVDYYENTLRNAILGAINPKNGTTTYFSPMATGYYKLFGKEKVEENMLWCCTGTGTEDFTKLGDSIYFQNEETLYVNLYIDSTLYWKEKGVILSQISDVTRSEKAEFTFSFDDPHDRKFLKIKFRIPDWACDKVTVSLNDECLDLIETSGYYVLDRAFHHQDKVVVHYPMKVQAYGLEDCQGVVGFKYGPTVLAAKLGTTDMDESVWAGIDVIAPAWKVVGNQRTKLKIEYAKTSRQVLKTEELTLMNGVSVDVFLSDISHYLVKEEGEDLIFHLKGTNAESIFGEELMFVPYNTITNCRYGIYWYFKEEKSV